MAEAVFLRHGKVRYSFAFWWRNIRSQVNMHAWNALIELMYNQFDRGLKMEQITIRIKDRKKAQTLLDFLKSLDFVESITEKDLSDTEESKVDDGEGEFFALAGLWAGRDISLKTIREQAWPYRT